ncbi:TerC/Alx family metal homeostasis membrane protein [Clostridium pasteurianum]|uniref:Integral membrane protein, TerC family n=1 Tax=Clostridium pasteurianum BC1 TaxID=86416 RepID=R4KFC0_CLOPA|nr:TerC/Alx family metal homeostasis membrane protein [Clostridium pasteurianum]AGK98305.1 integral membrane protein, TerC family [Clostridium pasteurianum BC1]
MSTKKILSRFLFWVAAAMIFNIGIYLFMGQVKALEFLGGYVIEQSLSMDNLFLFLIIFSSFGVKVEYQRRILNYGIFGAIILRLIFIILGVAIVDKFHWILYVFGIVLIISGIKMILKKEEDNQIDFKESKLIRVLNKIIPVKNNIEGEKFFVKEKGILYATPLFAILFFIEGSDILFAIDSIPAIFSISTDTFIVYSSNIFAILGLRNLYFLLEKLQESFKYVKYGVAVILTFTGIKLSILFFHIEISILISILAIVGILAISILASVFTKENGAFE